MKLDGNKNYAQLIEDASVEQKASVIVDVIKQAQEDATDAIIKRYQFEHGEVQANMADSAKYGLRQLNKEEKNFIDILSDPKQLAGIFTAGDDLLLPESIVNYVFEDLRTDHELFKHIDFAPAGLKKILLSETLGKAVWGTVDSKIEQEIKAELINLPIDVNKLSAFAFIPNAILELGHEWVERFIREALYEAMDEGLEEGFVTGTGKDSPIGLYKKLSGATDGVHPDRTKIAISDFGISELGKIVKEFADGGKRKVGKMVLIVNPTDAVTKVAAASRAYVNGSWVSTFPYDIEVVQSIHVKENDAILYLSKTYKAGVTGAKLSASDHVQFLDDNRVYKIVTLGNGRLVKENQAALLDITNLKPLVQNVNVVNLADVNLGA